MNINIDWKARIRREISAKNISKSVEMISEILVKRIDVWSPLFQVLATCN
jgi:hypothetical protein